jgi:hypothetical protein
MIQWLRINIGSALLQVAAAQQQHSCNCVENMTLALDRLSIRSIANLELIFFIGERGI